MEQIRLYNLMKRSIKVIQSTYLFSLLFISISSSLVFLIFHSTRSHFTLLPLDFNIGRNHMFLICNGILVILVKSSSSSTPSSPLQERKLPKGNDQSAPHFHDQSDEFDMDSEKEVVVSEDEENIIADQNTSFSIIESCVSERNVVVLDDQEHNEEESQALASSYYEENKEEEEEEEDEDELGAEELNKRCEEFIRRMKLGIISETRRLY